MIPVLTPDEVRQVDAAASVPVGLLVERAGAAVAGAAVRMMGGTYGRTVHVIAGKGNNGADGRIAARLLAERGVRVLVHDPLDRPRDLSAADLVIDAAYGTGFRGSWTAPDVEDVPVLAVDVPSGVDALTGEVHGRALVAGRTVTFAAAKPGLLLHPGAGCVGEIEVVDIGLAADVAARCRTWWVGASDVAEWLPVRAADSHKWKAAVRLVAGSTGMTGAATLAAAGAMRAGAGIVHLSSPATLVPSAPVEVVQRPLPAEGWSGDVLASLDRFHVLAIGPGLGRADATAAEVHRVVSDAAVPVVLDGDGLFAMAWSAEGAATMLRSRSAPTVLTPHDGEYAVLVGRPPGPDRILAARRLAVDTRSVVLLKGATTVVAEPGGDAFVVTSGDARLATAGSGDVLTGIVAALVAQGLDPFEGAAAAAWLHGAAASLAQSEGMVASEIAAHLPAVVARLRRDWT